MEYINEVLDEVRRKNHAQPEFLQAVTEVLETLAPVFKRNPHYRKMSILERMVEPERSILFRVTWVDDNGEIHVNRGYRIQFNSAIGPYKGGLRFHPTVNMSILKFLAFEQTFKNSLTTLPMGGGKGGSDFDPHGRSNVEIMQFCQAFMTELYRHISADTDVPAGDIGVGSREIGYLFGQYKKLANNFTGVLTGKGLQYGGSIMRPEATGYGLIYFAQNMLAESKNDIAGKNCLVSGSGNVAQFTVEKINELGGKVLTLSDSSGFICDRDGIDAEKLAWIMELKNERKGRIAEYVQEFKSAEFHADQKPWGIACDMAFPCAVQNELDEDAAKTLVKNGCMLVAEGANMPCTPKAIEVFQSNKVLYAPGKASNAGGVATSGLEMAQNSMRIPWTREEVDNKLRAIMHNIHENVRQTAIEYKSPGNYVVGANIAGFTKVADATIAQGLI